MSSALQPPLARHCCAAKSAIGASAAGSANKADSGAQMFRDVTAWLYKKRTSCMRKRNLILGSIPSFESVGGEVIQGLESVAQT